MTLLWGGVEYRTLNHGAQPLTPWNEPLRVRGLELTAAPATAGGVLAAPRPAFRGWTDEGRCLRAAGSSPQEGPRKPSGSNCSVSEHLFGGKVSVSKGHARHDPVPRTRLSHEITDMECGGRGSGLEAPSPVSTGHPTGHGDGALTWAQAAHRVRRRLPASAPGRPRDGAGPLGARAPQADVRPPMSHARRRRPQACIPSDLSEVSAVTFSGSADTIS